ncbi:MAG: hypothetical protein IPL61_32545 [Myxococcales bacterium]|nr:hypothetical protein [Myxococcales bacterium]
MTQIALGYYAVHKIAIHRSDALVERVARLLTDERWPWRPSLVRSTQFPGRSLYRWPKGRIPASERFAVVRDLLRSPETMGANLVASDQHRSNHTWFHVDSGQDGQPGTSRLAYPFEARALCLVDGERIGAWVDLMHELSEAIETPNAVILASDNESSLASLLYHTGGGPFPKGQHRDVPRYEIHRVNMAREWLGSRFTRPPGWGTYLAPEHLATIGGRERVAEVVAPPIMRDVGRLLYVQLSERAEDALAPEPLARKRAFWELLAPVTVPHQAIG